jgi:hypothetical protein
VSILSKTQAKRAYDRDNPAARLITVDRRDFTIYRRRNGTPVPCIMPPEKR